MVQPYHFSAQRSGNHARVLGQNRSLLTTAQSSPNRTQSQKLTVAECLNMDLNTVQVFVRDIVSAKRFYGEALGLRISADGSEHGYCVFEAGTATLVVEAVPSDATPADLDLVGRFTGL